MSFLTRSPAVLSTGLVVASIAALAIGLDYHRNATQNLVLEMYRERVRDLAAIVANAIDGDLHNEVVEEADLDGPKFRQAVTPLVKIHNQLPEVYYMYSMIVRDGRTYYVLDTTDQPDLETAHDLEKTEMLEEYESDPDDPWLDMVTAGDTYVNPGFETDDYGTFLSGHTPFYSSDGEMAGISGVDFDVRSFVRWKDQVSQAYLFVFILGSVTSGLLGFLINRFFSSIAAKADAMELASLTDPLTGAHNRRAFEERAENDFKRFKRTNIASSIAIFDADKFKLVNDNYGHDGGDEVLKALVNAVQSMLRGTDFLARWGGEEFTVIFTDTNGKAAATTADRVREQISKLPVIVPSGETINFTISIGVSTFEMEDEGAEAALARADEALYFAKENGRNQTQLKLGSGSIAKPR